MREVAPAFGQGKSEFWIRTGRWRRRFFSARRSEDCESLKNETKSDLLANTVEIHVTSQPSVSALFQIPTILLRAAKRGFTLE